MFEIVFSDKANETFDLIETQLLGRWGKEIAIEFELLTLKVIEKLIASPFIYQTVAADSNVRRAVIHKNCSLFYKVDGVKVVILFFLDNRQDPIFK